MTLRLCTVGLLAGLAAAVQAEPNPYYLGASLACTHDNNLLRLAQGQAAPAGLTQADTITSAALLGGFDQNIGREHLFGNLTLRDNRLHNDSLFDNQGYTLASGIDWASAERVSGSLKLNAGRNLASFNSAQVGLVTKKNLETTRQLDTTARIGVVTEFTLEGGAGYRSVDYSADEYHALEFRQNNLSLALRWQPDPAASLGLGLRDAHGRYPRFQALADGSFDADRFTRRDVDLDATLRPSGASSLVARLSLGKIDYEQATARNFSGVTGLLKWLWQPTGKLRLDTRLTRDPGQDSFFDPYFVFTPSGTVQQVDTVQFSRITESLRLRADYDLSAKISLNTSLAATHRSLTNTRPASPLDTTPQTGSDRGKSYAFGAVWAPTRTLSLGCDWRRDQRSGQAPLSSDFSDTTYSCYGQFTLQ